MQSTLYLLNINHNIISNTKLPQVVLARAQTEAVSRTVVRLRCRALALICHRLNLGRESMVRTCAVQHCSAH